MKKAIVLALVMLAMAFGTVYASVTERVEKMMATNPNANKEQTYLTRDIAPNDFALEFGLPLGSGFRYFRNINPFVAIGGGCGYTYPGFGADVDVKGYILTGEFSPYLSFGLGYQYADSVKNALTINGGLGVEYIFADAGWGLSVGVAAIKGITNTTVKIPALLGGDISQGAFNAEIGIHFRY